VSIDELRRYCLSLPGATQDIKWENLLTFCVAGKMFAITGLTTSPNDAVWFKCDEDAFFPLSEEPGIEPAPYLARHNWIRVTDLEVLDREAWLELLLQSYHLVREKLPKRVQNRLGDVS